MIYLSLPVPRRDLLDILLNFVTWEVVRACIR